MDYKYIEQLLELYWKGETSLEEEQILRSFFSQRDVPASLARYKELFCYEQSETREDVLGSDFDARMMQLIDEPEPVKARRISITQKFMPLFKAAAVVAIFLTLGNAAQVAFNGNDRPVSGMTVFEKTTQGHSVAMGDTAKADTLKKFKPTANVVTPSGDTME